ncbi:translation initiation factor IF-2-like [Panicum virgatum]|uniref:translation initiation factor IF-2-like n=1 Tax=Panicum virgatum TaxID=38727 RepID=UPI0019D5F63E|nr:translation initiation factor IF-2-like [Panicum virgatum]
MATVVSAPAWKAWPVAASVAAWRASVRNVPAWRRGERRGYVQRVGWGGRGRHRDRAEPGGVGVPRRWLAQCNQVEGVGDARRWSGAEAGWTAPAARARAWEAGAVGLPSPGGRVDESQPERERRRGWPGRRCARRADRGLPSPLARGPGRGGGGRDQGGGEGAPTGLEPGGRDNRMAGAPSGPCRARQRAGRGVAGVPAWRPGPGWRGRRGGGAGTARRGGRSGARCHPIRPTAKGGTFAMCPDPAHGKGPERAR